jgi:hypothetical protein
MPEHVMSTGRRGCGCGDAGILGTRPAA